MAKFEKCKYAMSEHIGNEMTFTEVTGYEFTVTIDNSVMRFCTHRNEKGNWELTERMTGMMTAPYKFGTRKECYEYATGEKHISDMTTFMEKHPYMYQAQSEFLEKLLNGEKFTVKQRTEFIDRRIKELVKADGKLIEDKPTNKPPKAPKAPKKVVETVEKLTIDNVREWVEGKNLRVEQANDLACVWVCGNSKEWKDEFEAAGFRWGKSKKYGKGWWKKPTR